MPELPPALLQVHRIYQRLPRDINGRSLTSEHRPALEFAGIALPEVQRRCHRLFLACDSEAAAVLQDEREQRRADAQN